jgi:hypothetical protein
MLIPGTVLRPRLFSSKFQKKKEKTPPVGQKESTVLPFINVFFLILGLMFVFSVLCNQGYIFQKKPKKDYQRQFKKFNIPKHLWTANESVQSIK